MFRISLALAAIALSACTIDENGNIVLPPPATTTTGAAAATSSGVTMTPMAGIGRAGTCYMYVTEQTDGKFALTTGIGDGTPAPTGTIKRNLSAAAVDAAFAKELAIYKVWPECLGIHATDRTKARKAKPAAKPAAPKA